MPSVSPPSYFCHAPLLPAKCPRASPWVHMPPIVATTPRSFPQGTRAYRGAPVWPAPPTRPACREATVPPAPLASSPPQVMPGSGGAREGEAFSPGGTEDPGTPVHTLHALLQVPGASPDPLLPLCPQRPSPLSLSGCHRQVLCGSQGRTAAAGRQPPSSPPLPVCLSAGGPL